MIKYLFALLLFVCSSSYAATINWCLTGTASGSVTQGTQQGSVSNINDDNTGTYFGSQDTASFGGVATIQYSCEVAFAEMADSITQVQQHHDMIALGDPAYSVTHTIDLYYGGSWNNVYTGASTLSSGTYTTTVNGTWSNVEKIRTSFTGSTTFILDVPIIYHLTNELRAYGPENVAGSFAYIL